MTFEVYIHFGSLIIGAIIGGFITLGIMIFVGTRMK